MKRSGQSGQILLITLLVLSVALTIALSLIGRTTVDTSISSQVEESTRAFSAAEAGIEAALRNGYTGSGTVMLSESNTNYSVTQETVGNENTYDAGIIEEGQTKTIWLVHHDASGLAMLTDSNKYPVDKDIFVCWYGPVGNALTPALEMTVYYNSGGSYLMKKIAYDQYQARSGTLGEGNQYTPTGSPNCNDGNNGNTAIGYGIRLRFDTDLGIPVGSTMYMLRLRPIYNATRITLRTEDAAIPLPGLGNTFTSCGASTPGVTRCISALQFYPEPPPIFDYVLYANNGSIQ
jgi:hypothetical protein